MIVTSPEFSFVQFSPCQSCVGAELELKDASDLAFQILVAESDSVIEYVIATDTEIELYREAIRAKGVIDGAYLFFINPTVSLYERLTENSCFKFGLSKVGQQVEVYSNVFKYSPRVQHTVLLEYRCEEELSLGFAYPDGMFNRVRFPCRIFKPQPKEESNIYVKRNGQRKVLSASFTKEFELVTEWVSEEFHDRISIALMHDITVFDGKLFTKSTNYEIGWEDEFLDSAPGKCKLIENIIYRNINCGGARMADSVDLAKLVEVVRNMVPIGTIWPYKGDATKIPEGWSLCDGSNGTPDLRGRFLVGLGSFVENGETLIYSNTMSQIGGEAKVKLGIKEMPKHRHISGAYSASGSEQSVYGVATVPVGERKEGGTSSTSSPYTSEDGEGLAHNNLPPFYTVAFIIRVSLPSF